MARMYPGECPAEIHAHNAEARIFSALKKQLSDDYIVIHSYPWLDESRKHLREGECDFLILHPGKGMLAVEAKSGEFRYDRDTREWIRGDGRAIQDPYLQAQKSVHILQNRLLKLVPAWHRAGLVFGHVVMLPDSLSLPGALPAHVSPKITILQGDMDKLPARLDQAWSNYGRPARSLDASEAEQVVNALLPEFKIIRSLGARMEESREVMLRLTEYQYLTLEAMQEKRRLIVKGCSGSGKTILAVRKARHLDADGARVLYLCYNRKLADETASHMRRCNAGVEVSTFHNLCRTAAVAVGMPYNPPADKKQLKEFFNTKCAELLLDALPRYEKRFDAIIVDEGQDFDDLWWIATEGMFADRDSGYFYIFCDPHQNLYGRPMQLPFSEPSMMLPVNCRNTQAISGWIRERLGLQQQVSPLLPKGTPPIINQVEDDRAERDAVRKTLHGLISQERIDSRRIVILGRHKIENSAFAKVRKLGNISIVDLEQQCSPTDVRYATIHSFKGFEADIVLLTGVGEASSSLSHDEENTLIYVGASRARLGLYVFCRNGEWGVIES